MSELIDLLTRVVGDVIVTFVHVWPFLLISVLAAVFVTVYIGTDRLRCSSLSTSAQTASQACSDAALR